jgi:tRNA pseudouridine55 synthase
MQTIYPINKPKGPTSHDMIDKIRRVTGIRKVGHAGTLDPLASGVLVVGVTREGTKKMHVLVKNEKEYIASIKLGVTSNTDDEEGKKTITLKPDQDEPNEDKVKEALQKFLGHIKQIPPIYSAIKVKGKAAYKYAREGKELKLEPRDAEIKEIELLEYTWPIVRVRFVTGSGVYIRSLARDIGQELTTGGYLTDLLRTRVGEFSLDQALTIEEFAKVWETESSTI